jgi:TonB family protein
MRGQALGDVYRHYFTGFVALAAIIHGLIIFFVVVPSMNRGFASAGDEMAVIDIPPETKIPPPPEELARPATPVIATEFIEEEITIAETEIVEDAPVIHTAPAPIEPKVSETSFVFTPYTVKPKCVTGCSPEELLRFYPPLAKKAGISCQLKVGLRINTVGTVTNTMILDSSGHPPCDEAVQRWAMTTSWTVAYNRDQPVTVWIAQPINVTAKR